MQLADVGENTTVGEVKAAQAKLTGALNVLAALPLPSGSGSGTLSNLKSANDQLAAAIKDLPDSATVGQVGPQLQTFKGKVAQAQAAATKLATTLNCKA